MNPKLSAIHSALDFIESHLGNEITVGEIAASAGYSLYHFIRRFNQVVGHSPYDFLMRRRLSEAALELHETDRLILDIALDFCFNTHETFSRAFKRMFDISPSQWRSEPSGLVWVLLPALSDEYLIHINQDDFQLPIISSGESGSQVRFFHPGPDQTLNMTLSYINHTWLPQAEIRLVYPISAEHFLPSARLAGKSASIPAV